MGNPNGARFNLFALFSFCATVFAIGALFSLISPHISTLPSLKASVPLNNLWNKIHDASTNLNLPPCQKTLLFAFSRTAGFGSSFGIYVRAGLWAKAHGYTLLVTTFDDWAYGDYQDYFNLPVLTCTPGPDAYEYKKRTNVGALNWQNASHLLMVRGQHEFIDAWIIERYINLDSYAALPPVNTFEALPIDMTTPEPVYDAFKDEHITFMQLWRPKSDLDGMVQSVVQDLNLNKSPSERPPVIGLHFRGGDKFKKECPVSDGCGNITTYLAAALETRQALRQTFCVDCKPVLALMTVEPDAYELFSSNSLSYLFDIRLLPPPNVGFKGHDQAKFNSLSDQEIVQSTMVMLRDLTALAIHADAFVVTASSNVGRVAIMLGGPNKLVRSLDRIFQPTTKQLSYYIQQKQQHMQSRSFFKRASKWRPFLEEDFET